MLYYTNYSNSYNYICNYNYNYSQIQLQPQLQLYYNYTTLQYNYITSHYTNYNYSYSYNYNYTTLHYTRLHYTPLHYILQLSLHRHIYNNNYTTLMTRHHKCKSTAAQLGLQLQYTTLHAADVGEVTTATIATTPANTTPTTFLSINGFSLPSVVHNNQIFL